MMKLAKSTILSGFLLLNAGGSGVMGMMEVTNCDDMQTAFDMAQVADVTVTMDPFADIICNVMTTFTLSSGFDVTIDSTEENLENFFGSASFERVRFEISNGSKITIEVNVRFELDEEESGDFPDVNGGAIYVGEDSNIVFLNNFQTDNIGVRSQTVDDSDFPDHENDGGCIVNYGYFRVNGFATMNKCENSGGGEGSPGRGGAIYNGPTGSMLFTEGIDITDVSITDDDGNFGAGFYNDGLVNIRGNSKFDLLRAESGGAIYNTADAVFQFKNNANVIFSECRSQDGNGGSIENFGFIRFGGPAVFIESSSDFRGGDISNHAGATINLSDDSYFFRSSARDPTGAPVYNNDGGILNYNPDRTYFVGTVDSTSDGADLCQGVFMESTGNCIE